MRHHLDIRRLLALACTVIGLLLCAAGTAQAAGLPWVKATGGQFVAGGKPIILRGFVTLTGGNVNGRYYSLADYQRMHSLGANFQSIRVEIGALGYVSLSSSYIAQLKNEVDLAGRAGIYSDLKLTDYDVRPSFDWTAFWKTPASRQRYFSMLQRLGHVFAGDSALMGYDVLNEPRQGTLGLLPSSFEAQYLNPFYEQAIYWLRKVDPGHIVLYQSENERGVGSEPYVIPLHSSNVAYAPHFYPLHPTPYSTVDYLPLLQQLVREAQAAHAPLLIGEFSPPWNEGLDTKPVPQGQYQAMMTYNYQLFNRYGVSYSLPWFANGEAFTSAPNGQTFTWSVIEGSGTSLTGAFRKWMIVPFEQAAGLQVS